MSDIEAVDEYMELRERARLGEESSSSDFEESEEVEDMFAVRGASESDEESDSVGSNDIEKHGYVYNPAEDDEELSEGEADRQLRDFQKRNRDLLARRNVGSDDEDDGDRRPKVSEKAWGKKRGAFYDAESASIGSDSDDVATRRAEEEMAVAEQRNRAAALDDDDIGLSEITGLAGLTSERKSKKEAKKKRKEEKRQAEQASRDLASLGSLLGTTSTDGVEVERVTHSADVATRLRVLSAEAPELEGLLGDLQLALSDISDRVGPAAERLRRFGIGTEEGNEFVETKLQLLLTYCMYIAFYLILKAERSDAKAHPVISEIVRVRNAIDALGPLDASLESELDGLLQLELEEPKTVVVRRRVRRRSKSKQSASTTTTMSRVSQKGSKRAAVQWEGGAAGSARASERVDTNSLYNADYVGGGGGKRKRKRIVDDGDNEFYEAAAMQSQAKKARTASDRPARDGDMVEGDKRTASAAIVENKGTIGKQRNNPRTKYRKKAEKARKKRKGQVRRMLDTSKPYVGEVTGIRTNVTHSIQF